MAASTNCSSHVNYYATLRTYLAQLVYPKRKEIKTVTEERYSRKTDCLLNNRVAYAHAPAKTDMTHARYIACQRGRRVRDPPHVGFFACFHAERSGQCLSVCPSVSYSRTTGYEAARERYQRLQNYASLKNIKAIYLKGLRLRDMP